MAARAMTAAEAQALALSQGQGAANAPVWPAPVALGSNSSCEKAVAAATAAAARRAQQRHSLISPRMRHSQMSTAPGVFRSKSATVPRVTAPPEEEAEHGALQVLTGDDQVARGGPALQEWVLKMTRLLREIQEKARGLREGFQEPPVHGMRNHHAMRSIENRGRV